MPANTPFGYPYPLPTEPVAEGAQAIRNLAEALAAVAVPHCRAYRTTDQAISNAAEQSISWEAETYDTHNMWSLADPTKMFCKVAGLYLITCHFHWNAQGAGSYRAAMLRLNNSATYIHYSQQPTSGVNAYLMHDISTIRRFSVNDYVQVNVVQDSGTGMIIRSPAGGNQPAGSHPYLEMVWLGG